MNVIFENEDATFRVEEDFKETRIKRKPKFHDEIINDTPYDCSKKKYEINVYNITLDTVIESLENRFSKHKEMYIDFEWLHPTNFKLINNLPENAMNKIAELLTDFSPNIDKKILQEQLIDFAGKWDSLSKTLLEEYSCMTLDLEKDDEEEESKLAKEHLVHKKTCKNCIFCCYQILWKYNVYATAYPELFLAYKFLLTLSITQVQCERTCGRFYYNVVMIISSVYASIPHCPPLSFKLNPPYIFLLTVFSGTLKTSGENVSPCQNSVLTSNSSDKSREKRKLPEISSSGSDEHEGIDKILKSSNEPSTFYDPNTRNADPSTSKKLTNEENFKNDIGKWVGRFNHLTTSQKMDILKRCWTPPENYNFSEDAIAVGSKRKFKHS
ncbi:hypothetical protein QTP88_011887 [Uroleucon formosanum]